jgi:hypothetical protein
MNEVAAPFLYLNPPPQGEALAYVLYEGEDTPLKNFHSLFSL